MRKMNTLSAAFLFAVVAAQQAGAAMIDVTTQGSWIGTYGKDGYILLDYARNADNEYIGAASNANDVTVLPAYISSYTYGGGAQQYMWENGTADPRAVQDPSNPLGPRKAATSFDNDDFFIDFNVNRPGSFQFSVYGLDWDNFGGGRNIILNVPGDSANLSSYQNGKWAVFNLNFATAGTFRLDIIDNQPGGNNTISVIAFDNFAIPEPSAFVLCTLAAGGMIFRGRRARA